VPASVAVAAPVASLLDYSYYPALGTVLEPAAVAVAAIALAVLGGAALILREAPEGVAA
jgi:hypothetical protein